MDTEDEVAPRLRATLNLLHWTFQQNANSAVPPITRGCRYCTGRAVPQLSLLSLLSSPHMLAVDMHSICPMTKSVFSALSLRPFHTALLPSVQPLCTFVDHDDQRQRGRGGALHRLHQWFRLSSWRWHRQGQSSLLGCCGQDTGGKPWSLLPPSLPLSLSPSLPLSLSLFIPAVSLPGGHIFAVCLSSAGCALHAAGQPISLTTPLSHLAPCSWIQIPPYRLERWGVRILPPAKPDCCDDACKARTRS